MRCIHLHNHNGRMAHCSLKAGKINMKKMIEILDDLRNIPIILEADYRQAGMDILREDLVLLKEAVK